MKKKSGIVNRILPIHFKHKMHNECMMLAMTCRCKHENQNRLKIFYKKALFNRKESIKDNLKSEKDDKENTWISAISSFVALSKFCRLSKTLNQKV